MDFEAAIRDRLLVTFTYDGLPRVVQPATYGRSSAGKLSLRACQVDGLSRRNTPPCWELYTVAKMVEPKLTGEAFTEFSRGGYTRGDSAFLEVIAEH